MGFNIDTIDVSAPSCADDVTPFWPDSTYLQILMHIADHDSHMDGHEFSGTKAKVMAMNEHTRVTTWKYYLM